MTNSLNSEITRSKIVPAWLTLLDPTHWINQHGFARDGGLILPAEPSSGAGISIALTEAGGHWIAIARENKGESWYQFDIASFISLWNATSPTRSPYSVDLHVDVSNPYILRHPSVIPMEVSFDHDADMFQRSIIYCVSDLSSYSD
jgi:hypothetical protein